MAEAKVEELSLSVIHVCIWFNSVIFDVDLHVSVS